MLGFLMLDPLFLPSPRTESLLRRSLSTLFASAPTLLAVSGIIMLPGLLLNLAVGIRLSDPSEEPLRQGLTIMVALLLGQLVQAAVVYAVFRRLRGEPAGVGQSLRIGLRRFFAVVGASILVSLALGGTGIATVFPVALLAALFPPLMVLLLASATCFAFVSSGLFLTVPALVSERIGAFAALARSWSLSARYRLPIFFIMLVLTALNLLSALLAKIPQDMLASTDLSHMARLLLEFVPAYLIQVPSAAFGAVLAAVAYHDLRAFKEGFDEHALADAFD